MVLQWCFRGVEETEETVSENVKPAGLPLDSTPHTPRRQGLKSRGPPLLSPALPSLRGRDDGISSVGHCSRAPRRLTPLSEPRFGPTDQACSSPSPPASQPPSPRLPPPPPAPIPAVTGIRRKATAGISEPPGGAHPRSSRLIVSPQLFCGEGMTGVAGSQVRPERPRGAGRGGGDARGPTGHGGRSPAGKAAPPDAQAEGSGLTITRHTRPVHTGQTSPHPGHPGQPPPLSAVSASRVRKY